VLKNIVALVAIAVSLLAPVATATPTAESITCAGAISWSNARAYVGNITTVKGRVVETYYARSSNGQPTFLDLGVGYPDPRRFTAIIWGTDRVMFGSPERRFYGRTICVRGLIKMYAGRPEMSVRSPSQIRAA
jgi:DNA/RNA endonuclease YhcR with UshA esterase domain